MITIDIPGFRRLELHYLVSDYNGTLAVDGELLPGVSERLGELAAHIDIHVITADTFGRARTQLDGVPVKLFITPTESQAEAKLHHVSSLGTDSVVAIGNGRNDRHMLRAVALGIALIQREGGAFETITNAHLVSTSILDALDLLRNPKRLIATLRA